MPVQVLSFRKSADQGTNWGFGGQKYKYGLSKLMKFIPNEEGVRKRNYFQLSWEYTFEYDNDTVCFAFALPYTFSMV